MRFPVLSAALAALCFALPVAAQKMNTMAFPGERSTATLAMFSADFRVGYMASINHGQPIWKPEYDSQLDALKGKLNRLGRDNWTTLMTGADLEFGGTKIPAGSYVVALGCDKEGKFSLALMDATKAMKAAQLPFGPQTWTPEFSVPLTLNKDANKEVTSKMTMTFVADEKEAGKGTFTLAWGKHTLTTAVTMVPAQK
jgi:Protein of unknown function (DUF2911)